MAYKTTKRITSLAGSGIQVRANSEVYESMFPADYWKQLLAEGVIVETGSATTKTKRTARKKESADA